MGFWNGRLDSADDTSHFRIFQSVNQSDNADVGFIGYAIDKGVELNKGRIGAQDGPDAIRKAFANLPNLDLLSFKDYGNVYCSNDLSAAQNNFADVYHKAMNQHDMVFLIGGGHDIAYAQYLGLRKRYPDDSIGVINIDAHFDTRLDTFPTSGTSFSNILEEDNNAGYLVLGIQKAGNTKALFDYAKEKDIQYMLIDEIQQNIHKANGVIETFATKYDRILFTICMDVVDSAYAPGVSAPAVFGMTPFQLDFLVQAVLNTDNVNSVSIAEMNPQYDVDNRTAKLIAQIMHRMIYK